MRKEGKISKLKGTGNEGRGDLQGEKERKEVPSLSV